MSKMKQCPDCEQKFRKYKNFKAHYEKVHKRPKWIFKG